MPRQKRKSTWFKAKKCLTNFFNTRESNENETCKEFDIEEVNSEAGSTRDLLIEVCPDNIDTANLDPELRVTIGITKKTPEKITERSNTRSNVSLNSDNISLNSESSTFSDSINSSNNFSDTSSDYDPLNSETSDDEIPDTKIIFDNMLIMTSPECLDKILKYSALYVLFVVHLTFFVNQQSKMVYDIF